MFPRCNPNIENKTQGGLDEVLEGPGQLLTHDGSDLAALAPGNDGQVLTADSTAPLGLAWRNSGVPSFPGSSTDNAVVRFDGTSGNVVQNSAVVVDDDGTIHLPAREAIQWGSDIKLYHDGGQDLVLGYAFNGDPSITSFTAGKVWTNEIYTPSIESNTHITVRAGGAGLWLSSGNLTVNHSLSVKQDVEVEGRVEVGGELSANTIKPTSDSKVTVESAADVLGDLGVAGNIEVAGRVTLSSTLDVDDNAQFTRDVAVLGILTAEDASFTNPISAPNFPSAATDKAVVRFNGTSGKVVQNSVVTITDEGTITTPDGISARNLNLVHVNSAQTAFSVGINGDPFPHGRFAVRADGSVRWGNGVFLDVQLRRSAARTLLLDGVTGPATLALANGSSITWSGSPNSSNTINLAGGQVYAGSLNIAPNGSLAWKNTGSGNGGALVNTGDGQWELRDSSGETSTTSLKVGQIIGGLPVTNWIINTQAVDFDGIMANPCWIRVAKMTNKIWYFEVGDASFAAAKDGVVMFYLGVRADFIRSIPLIPMWIGDQWGSVGYNPFSGYLSIRPGLSYPLGSFVQGNTYTWNGVSFTVSEA